MNKPIFFAQFRSGFGALDQQQVEGLDFLLDQLETDPPECLEQAAYILATAWHETAGRCVPVKEAFWVRDPDEYRKRLRYAPWFGRGYVQLTWQANYAKAGKHLGLDLTTDPDAVMEPRTAYRILLRGMLGGWFSGPLLSDFIHPGNVDYVGARKTVNGLDKARLIASYAERIAAALAVSGYVIRPVVADLVIDLPTLRAPFGNTAATKLLTVALGATLPDLEAAVLAFQSANRLIYDGIVGPETWGVLFRENRSA